MRCHLQDQVGKLETGYGALEKRVTALEEQGPSPATFLLMVRELQSRLDELEKKPETETNDEYVSLKPCPFCKCESLSIFQHGSNGLIVISCEGCRSTGPPCKTEKQARNAWDERS